MGDSRRWMRGIGAGLMEAGRQAEISRREALEQQRQQNILSIAEGRQGLMRDQLEQQIKTQATARTDSLDDKFYNRVDAKINEAYGKAPLTAMETLILKASLENSVTGNPNEVIKQLKEQGVLPETAKPSVSRLNNLYKTIESEWKATIGKGEEAGEFNIADHINRFPLLQQGAETAGAYTGDPNAEGDAVADQELGGSGDGGVLRNVLKFLTGDWMDEYRDLEEIEPYDPTAPPEPSLMNDIKNIPNRMSDSVDAMAAYWNTSRIKGKQEYDDLVAQGMARGDAMRAGNTGGDVAGQLTQQAQHGHMVSPEAPLMRSPEVPVGPPAPPAPPAGSTPQWLNRKY